MLKSLPKPIQSLVVSASLLLFSALSAADVVTGLEIDSPRNLNLVYTIEPAEIEQINIESIVGEIISTTNIKLTHRSDAQLFLRVEKHAGLYLLYLDFSRQMTYRVDNKCFTKGGFVWGRYAKNIEDVEQLHEDVHFFVEEFINSYRKANSLD